MSNEDNKLTLLERAETWLMRQDLLRQKKRDELRRALEDEDVHDPISGVLISIAISAAISAGTAIVTSLLTPRQKTTQGQLTGDVTIMNSQLGLFIPEIVGADPGDGLGGGCRIAPNIIWTSGIRKVTTTSHSGGGGKGFLKPKAPDVTTVSYNIDLALMWCYYESLVKRIYANTDTIYNVAPVTGGVTGIIDINAPNDPNYDPLLPVDPNLDYDLARQRSHGNLNRNPTTGVKTGTLLAGGYANIANYPGNAAQLQDPTIQADTDTKYGANSTPAYVNRNYTVLKTFDLSARYGGSMPNFMAIVESVAYKDLNSIFGLWSTRTGLLAGDIDFTAVSAVKPRGILISQQFQPAQMMNALRDIYNVKFYETDKVYAEVRGAAGIVATISEDDIGWYEDTQPNPGDVLVELNYSIPDPVTIPNRVDVTYLDPTKENQANLQGEARQVTGFNGNETISTQITMTSDESRAVAQRELYRKHVERPYKFNLSYKYLWLNAGDEILINMHSGITHHVEIESIKKAIGAMDLTALSVVPATYTQPISTDAGAHYLPPAQFPKMSIAYLLDVPLLRDEDAAINQGMVLYVAATPRTSATGVWTGAVLYRSIGAEWLPVVSLTLPATAGRTTSDGTGILATPANALILDTASTVTVDLYSGALSSVTTDVLFSGSGVNAAIVGDEIVQFLTATRVNDGSPNRWTLTNFLRARKGTYSATSSHVTNERFLLLDSAVEAVAISVNELNVTRNYKMVTAGQSLDEAATVALTYTGKSAQPHAPSHLTGSQNTRGDRTLSWIRTVRSTANWRSGADTPLGEEKEQYLVEVMNGANVARAFTVTEKDAVIPFWTPRGQTPAPTLNPHGGLALTMPTAYAVYEYDSVNLTNPPARFDFVAASDTAGTFGIFDPTKYTAVSNQFNRSQGGGPSTAILNNAQKKGYYIGIGGGIATPDGGSAFDQPANEGDVFTLFIRDDGRVDYYRNYAGESSRPFYTSPTRVKTFSKSGKVVFAQKFAMYALMINPTASTVTTNSVMFAAIQNTETQATALYTFEMMLADFGSAQTTVTFQVSQISGLYGAGERAVIIF